MKVIVLLEAPYIIQIAYHQEWLYNVPCRIGLKRQGEVDAISQLLMSQQGILLQPGNAAILGLIELFEINLYTCLSQSHT